jgi:hypothetical protein
MTGVNDDSTSSHVRLVSSGCATLAVETWVFFITVLGRNWRSLWHCAAYERHWVAAATYWPWPCPTVCAVHRDVSWLLTVRHHSDDSHQLTNKSTIVWNGSCQLANETRQLFGSKCSGGATVLPLRGPLEGPRANQGVQLTMCMHAKHTTVAETGGSLDESHFQLGWHRPPPGPSCSAAC